MSALPLPDDSALAHSARLTRHLQEQVVAAGGAIPFSRFMELCLYTPGLGYYSAGASKFGEAGDFVTAPELGPLFAACTADAIAPVIRQLGPEAQVLEMITQPAGQLAGRAKAGMFGQGLGHPVGQAHDPVFAEALLPAGADALSPGLEAVQADLSVVPEGVEDAHGVGAAADAGDDRVGQQVLLGQLPTSQVGHAESS